MINTTSTDYEASDEDILEAIARHGEREHVLAELAQREDMSALGARGIANEDGLPADASAEEIAKHFIKAIERWWNTYTDEELHSLFESNEHYYGDHPEVK